MIKLKSLAFASLALILFNGCMNENSENRNEEVDSITLDQGNIATSDSANVDKNSTLPYIVNFDEGTGRLEIDENPNAEAISLNSEQLVLALKNKYPEISVRVGERKQDTLELHIDDATYLTQSIGSTGANAFLAEATYAFTSLDSIKVVNFMFEPGDHAMPGPYDRKYFKDFH